MGKLEDQLHELRHDYAKKELSLEEVGDDPMAFFKVWLDEAMDADVNEPNAMDLATVSEEGMPSVRVVLLRKLEEDGFIFFTNFKSQKGKEIEHSGLACLNFFWPELERQVQIQGKAEEVEKSISDEYFQSRPRESQLGAWTSPQSKAIEKRSELESRYQELEKEYEGKEIPRPPFWGGFRIIPWKMEFWQGRVSRLHDRIQFVRTDDGGWEKFRLSP